MGLLTKADFRTRVLTAIGGRNPGTTTLNTCIDGGVLDVASAVDLPELDSSETQPTVNGNNFVTLADPEGTLAVKLVYSVGAKTKLDYMEIADLFSHDFNTTGAPLRWARNGGTIYLHPVPTSVISLLILTKLKPSALANDAAATAFHEMWDEAVLRFAVANAFDIIGEQDRGQYWRQNAVQYCMTRLSDADFVDRVSGLSRSMPLRQGAGQQEG